jgi:hypothetical protein
MPSVRAVRWYGNRDIRLDHLELPPLEYGQVRIAPAWCGICGSDLGEWEHGPVRYIPYLFGSILLLITDARFSAFQDVLQSLAMNLLVSFERYTLRSKQLSLVHVQ